MIFKKPGYWLLVIVLLSLALRLRFLYTPLADWHSFRQADTASVAREYLKNGLDLWRPQYHDLSDIQSGRDNPQGFRMVEFPLVSALVALTYPVVNSLTAWPLHVWYRFTSVLFSLGSLLILYYLARSLFSFKIALYTALFFGIIPYNVYYGRSIFPENALVFFGLLTLYLSLLIHHKSRWYLYLLVGLSGALALLLKPMAAFMLLPLLVPAYFDIRRQPKKLFYWLLSVAIMFLPLYWWRTYIQKFPEGIPVSTWLLNSNGIRLRPAWFRWLFYERLTKLMLGFTLLPIFIAGTFSLFISPLFNYKPFSHLTIKPFSLWFLVSWITGILAYLIIFATGNIQHDYYQIMTVPLICLLLGLGVDLLLQLNLKWLTLTVFGLTGVGLWLSWRLVGGYYQINHWEIVHAGLAVDQLTPKEALVIAPYQGDTAFLYQTNRRGWPIGTNIEAKIRAGAQYYVSITQDDETKKLQETYPVVTQTPEFVLLKLR